jgi:hypothetical protein
MKFQFTMDRASVAAFALACVAFGFAARIAAAEEPTVAELARILQADDFWSHTGAKRVHAEIPRHVAIHLRQFAGNSDNAVPRIRANKILLDLYGRSRQGAGLSDEQDAAIVEGSFRYLETHLSEDAVKQFRPELGFSHFTTTKRADDLSGLWLLLEFVDGVLPSGGLNIRWNPETKSVDKVEHWGMTRQVTPAS